MNDNSAAYYYALLDRWENESYVEGYGGDWLETIGERVKLYAYECAVVGRVPTFKGLVESIKKLR